MPPFGPGLSKQEIDVLQRWISQGAPMGDSGTDAGSVPIPADSVAGDPSRPAAEASSIASTGLQLTSSERSGIDAAAAELRERGVAIRPVSAGNPLRVLNANGLSHRIDPPFGDDDLALVADLGPILQDIDLANTDVTDQGISHLAGFDRLERISLKDTSTSDPAARVLASLPALRVVNFFGTGLTDQGLLALAGAADLERVYAGQTAVTADGVRSARKLRPDLVVVWETPRPAPAPGTPELAP